MRRRLLVVAGKGGVGRSTVSAGLAVAAAERGAKVLAIDGLSDGGLRRALGHKPRPGIDVIDLNTEVALREYLDLYLHIPIPGLRLGPIAKAFDFLAVAAPGVREILAMGKVCNVALYDSHDLVILDAPATGHVVELLASPDTLAEMVPLGPLTKQTAWMRTMLADETTAAVVVTLAEELPVSEALDLYKRITAETSVAVRAVVANRVPRPLSDKAKREAIRLAKKKSNALGIGAKMLLDSRRRATEALEPLAAAIDVPIVTLPEHVDSDDVLTSIAPLLEELL